MKILHKLLCILVMSSFFGNTINAMDATGGKEESPTNEKPSGLHRPIKQSPAGFIKVEPLENAQIDEDGRTYYVKTVAKPLTPNTPPISTK